jgi:hypothetical protein
VDQQTYRFMEFENKKELIDGIIHFPMLEDIAGLDSNQLLKHYFRGYPLKERHKIHNIIISNGADDMAKFNVAAHGFLVKIEQRKADDLPFLLHSIILNSLAFEANEELAQTVYIDAKDKQITAHVKHFIAAQHKIYKNAHSSLFGINEEETQTRLAAAENTVKLIYNYNLMSYENLEKVLEEHFQKTGDK